MEWLSLTLMMALRHADDYIELMPFDVTVSGQLGLVPGVSCTTTCSC
jgi:hypothetical protein